MNPADEHIMRDDAKLACAIAAELIFNNIVVRSCTVVAGSVSIANGPISRPVRERW